MCYLANQLVTNHHQVTLFGRFAESSIIQGVHHVPDNQLFTRFSADFDVIVIQNTPFFATQINPHINSKTKLVFWCQHNPDQSPVRLLHSPQFVQLFHKIVFVSPWQMHNFINTFHLPPHKCEVLRNAISPAFEKLFTTTNIIGSRSDNITLAYATIPHRGLDILLEIFPTIKQSYPSITLNLYSGMQVYQQPNDHLSQRLINQALHMEGVHYVGPLPQKELALKLSQTSIYSYPNTVAETSCIGVMEALAAGCSVITSELGALPDTANGYATLVPITNNKDRYVSDYTSQLLSLLKNYTTSNKSALNSQLVKQVKFFNTHCTWTHRATEWEKLLMTL
jgi:glycosyltransferase involved in cell wall biosynthesis